MPVAIEVDSISKRYRLGEYRAAYGTLRESLVHAGRRLTGREHHRPTTEVWALRDVSFQVPEGQVLGIIGRNGAGKSTLLKILTRIATPTSGRAEIRGRVGSLLEVGTGFNQELTGRENVYLNGAILGMKRREIDGRFEEIVDFSGVERFIDTPVKRYSSGMYVRLAFAVAAHLEPEVLLVDEVLAVGDTEFQRKCLGKMRDAAGHGRTVVFVSHDLGAIRRLCGRAVLLDDGTVVADGPPADVVSRYLQHALPGQATGRSVIPDDAPRNGTGEARLREVALTEDDGSALSVLHLNQRLRVTAVFEVGTSIADAVVEVGISTFGGDRIVTVQSTDREGPLLRFDRGRREIGVELDTSMLPGEFAIDVALHHRTGITVDHVQDALRFTAVNAAERGDDHYPWSVVRGYVRPHSTWSEVGEPNLLAPAQGAGPGE
jgi:lipopolysaccharide transport system ATP-binding protein